MKILALIIISVLAMLIMPSVGAHEIQVNSGDDDATERDNGVFNSTQQTIRIYSNPDNSLLAYRCGGFRFENVDIPQGVEIESAYLQLFVTTLNDMNVEIYAQDNDDTLNFVSNANIIDNVARPKTTASIPWIENGITINSWENSDNLATLIQEVVDRSGWARGNSITLLLIAHTDQILETSVRAYEFGASTFGAVLHVFWQPTIESTESPIMTLPRSVFRVSQVLESHGEGATDITAKITFSDNNFNFLSGYPDNTGMLDNLVGEDLIEAEWYVSPPVTPDNYAFSIEWGFIHDNGHTLTSDNFDIEVKYFVEPTPHTIPVFPISLTGRDALAIVALGLAISAFAIVIRNENREAE